MEIKKKAIYESFCQHDCEAWFRCPVCGKQPLVDAVKVVRCKDCKHSTWDEEEHLWECTNSYDLTGDADTYAMFHEYNDGEHYCSYGERKDND